MLRAFWEEKELMRREGFRGREEGEGAGDEHTHIGVSTIHLLEQQGQP